MAAEKMPISLLRNSKTISYLQGMFEILNEGKAQLNFQSLEKKVISWIHGGSNRLDLNETESALLEQSSHTAYSLVNSKKDISPLEKTFVDQHEFFFKN